MWVSSGVSLIAPVQTQKKQISDAKQFTSEMREDIYKNKRFLLNCPQFWIEFSTQCKKSCFVNVAVVVYLVYQPTLSLLSPYMSTARQGLFNRKSFTILQFTFLYSAQAEKDGPQELAVLLLFILWHLDFDAELQRNKED